MHPTSSEQSDKPTPPGYEPPRVTIVGTVRELTQAVGTGVTDAAVFSTAISDRRLKDGLRPVDASAVLTTLGSL